MSSEEHSPDSAVMPEPLSCPVCGQWTDSLKKYGFVKWWWVFLALVIFRREDHASCPSCMRKYLWRRCLLVIPINVLLSILWLMVFKAAKTPLNLVLANIWTEFALIPWLLILTVATTRPGHSKGIVAPQPRVASAAIATEQPKSSWVSTIIFWIVLIGGVFGFVYWLTTLR